MASIDNVFAGLKTKLGKFKEEFGKEFVERVKDRTPVRSGALQKAWEFRHRKEDIEISNSAPYASHVEYGTPKMEPRGMLRATALESEQIAQIAAERAGLK